MLTKARRIANVSRVLIAASLVIHLGLGCCAHHAHACEGTVLRSVVQSDGTTNQPSPSRDAHHSHHGTDDCQGTQCSYVSPDRTLSDSLGPSLGVVFVSVLDDPIPTVGIGLKRPLLTSGRLLLPVRLHLANQVLLI